MPLMPGNARALGWRGGPLTSRSPAVGVVEERRDAFPRHPACPGCSLVSVKGQSGGRDEVYVGEGPSSRRNSSLTLLGRLESFDQGFKDIDFPNFEILGLPSPSVFVSINVLLSKGTSGTPTGK